jgi:hypothetical protein
MGIEFGVHGLPLPFHLEVIVNHAFHIEIGDDFSEKLVYLANVFLENLKKLFFLAIKSVYLAKIK